MDHLSDEDLDAALAQAPREAEPARDLWADIAPRLTGARPSTGRAGTDTYDSLPINAVARISHRLPIRAIAWQLAAGIVLFASGLASGLMAGARYADGRAATVQRGGLATPATTDSLEVAAAIQAAGTQYVTAIARLTGTSYAPALVEGRNAAIAALYAASRQLAELSPEDEDALAILHTVSRSHVHRFLETPSRAPSTVRF